MDRKHAIQRARRNVELSGHPDVSWSIILEAELAQAVSTDAVEAGLADAFRDRPALGPVPFVRSLADTGEMDACRAEFADRTYRPGEPGVRVAVCAGAPSFVVLAAHHGLLDGMGLVALLGAALDLPLASSAAGLGPRAAPSRGFARAAVARVAEALLIPPTRIAPARHVRAAGDELVAGQVAPWRGGTSALIAAAVRAIHAWNGGAGSERIAVAVGASKRPGARLGLELDSAYLRLRVPGGTSVEEIHRRLASTAPEPAAPRSAPLGPIRPLVRSLSSRLGSTILVSNLGTITGAGHLRGLRFHPVAHGRSGVALGAATVGSRATLTVRARRSDFDVAAAEALLERVVDALASAPDPT